MNYVIIGAGPAGVVAAETLRKEDAAASVTLIGDEGRPPYSRMAIPYMLEGKIDAQGTELRKGVSHYQNLGINYVQDRVKSVDDAAKTVTLEAGGVMSFDRLLIATGSRAVKPPIMGLDHPAVQNCWTLDHAEAIAEKAQKSADVVLMGAGFIGCIVLESLALRGVNLTVVEAADRMAPVMMNKTSAAMLKSWCESKGVTIRTATKVTEVADNAGRVTVSLDDGSSLEADLLVVATGVKTNMDFLEGSNVACHWGVVVDNALQTNVEGIFAAGDVAQGPDFSTGDTMVHPIQTTAADHGRVAALNMLGQGARYKGSLIMNVLETVGLVSAAFGHWQDHDSDFAEASDPEAYRYTRLVFDGDVITAAFVMGGINQIGVLRGLIESRTQLGAWKERLKADPTRIAEAYVDCTR